MNDIYNCVHSIIQNGVFDNIKNVPLMDSKNITNLILSNYVDKGLECSLHFLTLYLSIISGLFDKILYLNKKYTDLYIIEFPDLEDNIEPITDNLIQYLDKNKNGLNLIEQYLIVQLHLLFEIIDEEYESEIKNSKVMKIWFNFYSEFLNKYLYNISFFKKNKVNITKFTDFLEVKINQPILLLNPVFLNTDSRSVRSKDYRISSKLETSDTFIYTSKLNVDLKKPKFDIYCPNGFTIYEYLIHFLTIRGNPMDRWYTMYSDCVDRSYYKTSNMFGYKGVIKFEEQYNKMIANGKIKDNFKTIYISFDHGS